MVFLTAIAMLLIVSANADDAVPSSRSLEYDVISPERTAKLKAIRDSYGSIPNLDRLYEDRTHANGLPYHVYAPEGLKAGEKYPLVVFLHGYSDLTVDTHKGFPKGVWSLPLVQERHPHILFVPRYRTFDDMWVQESFRAMVIEALDDLVKDFNGQPSSPAIDSTRIYLTGFSQGGMGTWNFIKHYPHKFAAASPLSGFSQGPQTLAEAEVIKHIPIWIFNGDGDRGVNGSRLSFQMLKNSHAPDVRYHEYAEQGHVIDDFAYFTDGFFDWLFAQKLRCETPGSKANGSPRSRGRKSGQSDGFRLGGSVQTKRTPREQGALDTDVSIGWTVGQNAILPPVCSTQGLCERPTRQPESDR